MRIRKRFPSSSLSSVSFSDPQRNSLPVVQQNHIEDGTLHVQQANTDSQPSDPPNQSLSPFSDQHMMIGGEKTRWVFSCSTGDEQKVNQKDLEGENHIRRRSILGAQVGAEVLQPSGSGSSHQVVGRWYEGDKIVPLKKRIGSFERTASNQAIGSNGKKMKARMKSKTNKKCLQQNDDDEESKETKDGIEKANPKKNKRGSVIMEGSRCSRVNGRGWRCCQQTLVGYSLCEHHLGKGRLRSMASVRNSDSYPGATKNGESELILSSSSPLGEAKEQEKMLVNDSYEEDRDDDKKVKPLMVTKKRMKLGMVKARSISSLLSQTNNAMVVSDNKQNISY